MMVYIYFLLSSHTQCTCTSTSSAPAALFDGKVAPLALNRVKRYPTKYQHDYLPLFNSFLIILILYISYDVPPVIQYLTL